MIDPAATGALTNTAHVAPPPGVTDPNPGNNNDSDTDTLTPQADLAITKTDGVTSVAPGTSTTYTIVVRNAGPSTVSGASVADPLPAGSRGGTWAFASATGGGAVSGPAGGTGDLTTTVDLPVGATVTFTLTVAIDPAAKGTVVNTATVSPPAGVTDANPANNSATDTDTLTPQADLAITKTDGVTSVVPGTPDTYIIVVSNNGPTAVTGASVADPLPAGVTAATWTATDSSGGGAVSGPASGTGALATTVNLPAGASVTFSFMVQVDPGATGTLANTATVTPPAGVTDTNPANNTASDSDTLTPQSDLSITKTDGVLAAVPGGSTTYTIVVSNKGPSTAVDQAVTDNFPASITAVSWTAVASAGSSVAAASGSGNIVTTVTLLPGGTVTFTAVATISASATGTLSNTATVAQPPGDTTPADNSATDTDSLTPLTGLSITKTDSTTTAVPGTSTTYTLTVSNAGPSAATGAALSDPLPAGVTAATWTFVSATGGGSVTGPASGTGALATTIDLAVGATLTFSFTATIDPTATGTVVNTATVTPSGGTPTSATDTDTLTPQADLSVTKDDGKTSAVPGTSDTYTLTVSNAGPSTVTSVTLTDSLPAALLNPVFGTPSSGSYDPATGVWSGLSLVAGQSITITLSGTIDPPATGALTNTAHVAPPPGVTDTNPGNNNDSDTDTLTPQVDLAITKTDGVTSVVAGGSTTYTIVVSNAGPSAVNGASVADSLPAGATGGSWAFAGATAGGSVSGPAGGTGTLATTVDLPVGATVTFTFTVAIDPAATGTLVNTATVSPPAGVTDTNPANNSATDTDTLTPQADLAITKTDGVTSVAPGTSDTYIIVVSNIGPSAVTGASVSDPLPADVTAATWTSTDSSGGGAVTGPASGTGALATTVNLPVGATVTFTFTATIDPSATGTLTNTATITSPAGVTDTNPANNSTSDSDTLTPQSDLSITKDDGVLAAVPGGSTTYTIVVSNHGPSTAVAQPVTDNFPAPITAASWTAVASAGSSVAAASGSGNIATTVTLLPGGTVTFTAFATINSAATGTLTNTATVAVPPGDTTPADNTATDTDTLTPLVGLSITKTDGTTTAVPGTSTTYTIVVSNAGPSVATGAALSDPLPVGVTAATWTFVSTTGGGSVTGAMSGTGVLATTIDLPVGATITFNFTATIDPAATGTVVNTAAVTPPQGTPTSGTDTDTLTPQADLSVTKDDGKSSAVPGTNDTYTLTVSNAGPSTVTTVNLTDSVPAALLNPVFGTPSSGSYDPATGIWSGLSLAAGQSITITLSGTVDPAATGALTNTAHVAPPPGVTDPNPANNNDSDTDTLTPEADLAITNTDGVTSVVPGTSTTYTIVVGNNGPSDVTGASVADALPAGATGGTWTFVSATGGGSVSGPASGSGALGTTVDLPAGATATFTFTVQVSPSATGTLDNTATVSTPAGVTDTNLANNTATDIDTLTPQSDLSITKTDGVTSVVPGTSTTYTITVSNAGPSTAMDQAVTDDFPAAITGVSWTAVASAGSSVAAASGTGNITTTVTLLPGGTVTFTAVSQVSASATGSLTNTATVAVPPGDTTPADNTASDVDTLTPQADLSITKTDGVTSVVPGTSTTYTITVHNSGPSTAVDQAVTDDFPASITGVSWTAVASAGSSVAAASGTGNIMTTVTLLPGGTVTFTAVSQVSASATGSLSNTATVPVPPGDTTPGDNTATDTNTLTPQADLAITNTDGVTSVVPGTSTTYTIVASNNGPSDVTGASVLDLVPAGATGGSWTFTVATEGGAVTGPTSGSGALGTTVNLPAGASVTFTFTVQVSPSATGTLDNTANVSTPAGVTDTNPANNTATDVDTLTPQADLALTKTAGPGPFSVGQQITYTLTVSNHGPSVEPQASLVDMLPAGVTFVSASVPPASQSAGSLTFQLGTLAAGASDVITVTVQANQGGMLVNQATVTGSVPDLVPSNNTASVTITVTQTAPTVLSLERLGFHEQPTLLVLGFSEPLDAATAQDLGNYQLTLIAHGGRLHRSVPLTGAVYNATTDSVTLQPAQLLPLRFNYKLVVNGSTPTGVASSSGVLLDGAGNGVPGSNYVRVFGREVLAGPNPMDSRHGRVLAHQSHPGHTRAVPRSGRHAAPPAPAGAGPGAGVSSVIGLTGGGVGLKPSAVDAALESFVMSPKRK
jgi:uncharacterized repeat protein (TIGR01451 family)